MARRKRCHICDELHPPDEITLVGGKPTCEGCLATVEKDEPPPSDPTGEAVIGGAPRRDQDTPGEKAARIAAIREKHGLSDPPEPTPPTFGESGITTGAGKPGAGDIAAQLADDEMATSDHK